MNADLAPVRWHQWTAAVMRATAPTTRRALSRLEHQLDLTLREACEQPTHGLAWAEVRRGTCHRCRVEARLWTGSWFEFVIAPGRVPFAIVSTPFLCAACVVWRQWAERMEPIWRPAPRPRRAP